MASRRSCCDNRVHSVLAIADDWVATKLRGGVVQLVDNEWVKLARGDIVPGDSVIRTLKGGRVSLQRGNEIIDLSGDTQVQILDRAGRSQFTTVKQHFGTVAVEADVRQVQHFSVETPHLAAVVKGTKFTVVSGTDTAKVSVQRGHVAVEDADTHQTTLLSVGQSASTGDGGVPLAVSERGAMPVIYSANGKPAGGSKEVGGAIASPKAAAAAAAARDAGLAASAGSNGSDNGGSRGNSGNAGSPGIAVVRRAVLRKAQAAVRANPVAGTRVAIAAGGARTERS